LRGRTQLEDEDGEQKDVFGWEDRHVLGEGEGEGAERDEETLRKRKGSKHERQLGLSRVASMLPTGSFTITKASRFKMGTFQVLRGGREASLQRLGKESTV